MTHKLHNGRPLACAIAGAVMLLDALAARLALRADEVRVYILGHPIAWQCAMRRIGLPCPTCGMTRSMVLALNGDIARAWHVAPGGPVLAAGVLAMALVLLFSAFRRTPWPGWVRAGGVIYLAAATAIWLGGWAAQFARAWHAL